MSLRGKIDQCFCSILNRPKKMHGFREDSGGGYEAARNRLPSGADKFVSGIAAVQISNQRTGIDKDHHWLRLRLVWTPVVSPDCLPERIHCARSPLAGIDRAREMSHPFSERSHVEVAGQ